MRSHWRSAWALRTGVGSAAAPPRSPRVSRRRRSPRACRSAPPAGARIVGGDSIGTAVPEGPVAAAVAGPCEDLADAARAVARVGAVPARGGEVSADVGAQGHVTQRRSHAGDLLVAILVHAPRCLHQRGDARHDGPVRRLQGLQARLSDRRGHGQDEARVPGALQGPAWPHDERPPGRPSARLRRAGQPLSGAAEPAQQAAAAGQGGREAAGLLRQALVSVLLDSLLA